LLSHSNRVINILLVVLSFTFLGKVEDDYEFDDFLGQGVCGMTYKCKERSTGDFYACKSISKSDMTCLEVIEMFKREVELMRHLSKCNSIVKYKDAYENEAYLHIVMELCSGGTLMDLIDQSDFYLE
jgi:calcium-dependent protein kinase